MWIYPVDMKRTNEFGQTFQKEKVDEQEEVDQSTTSNVESNINTSKAKKRSVKSKKQE